MLSALLCALALMTNPLQQLARMPADARSRVLAQFSDQELAQLGILAEGLNAFIPRVSPTYTAPRHLQPLVDLLEQARDTPVEVVVHAPPRHTKTETILHAIAQMVSVEPARTNAYVTYAQALAQSKSRKARLLATAAGVTLAEDAQRLEEWRTAEGGGLLATGVGGPLTGHGVNGLLIVDDPFKNRVEAESATTREKVWEWFNDVAYTRKEPGASVIVVATRWHPQDLSGKLISERGWKYLKLPALDGDGHALWPERFNAALLADVRKQVGEYTWASLYQGEPRARGGSVFGDVHTYDASSMNWNGARTGLGVDCAYSAKTYSNYSVGLVLVELGGVYYVRDVQRHQVKTTQFKAVLDGQKKAFGARRSRWYTSTTEEGTAELLDITPVLAREDKFVRAQPVAAAWNAGNVRVPANAPWADAFISEVAGFTGVDDDQDDQVDALAAAYDLLAKPSASYDGWSGGASTQRRI